MRELLLQGSHSHNAQRKLFSVLHHRERSEADVNFVMEYLATELLFFQELPNAAKRAIATHAICQHVRPGVQILKESDSALALYLVWSCSGTVHRKAGILDPDLDDEVNRQRGGNVRVTVEKGDTFGEEGLLNRIKNHKGDVSSHEIIPNGEASITVRAHPIEGMVCFVIDFLVFIKYIWPQHETLCWAPSHCIEILGKEIETRSHGNIEMVRRFVAQIPFFQQLSRCNQTELCRVMRQEKHEGNAHKIIFQEGWPGDSFYVIISGQVSVHQRLKVAEMVTATGEGEAAGEDAADAAGEGKKQPFDRSAPAYQTVVAQRFQSILDERYGPAVAELRHGDSFGEKALHVAGVRNASIICQSEVVLLMVIDRESYNRIIKPKKNNIVMNVASAMDAIHKPPRKRKEHDVDVLMPLVSGLPFFKQLPTRLVRHLVREIRLVEVSPQKIICEQGTHGETMHVILR